MSCLARFRSCIVSASAVLLACAPAIAAPAAATVAPTAATVLARAKQASGGAAWDGVRSAHMRAAIETSGLSGTLEAWDDMISGRGVSRYSIGPYGGAGGFDGEAHWSQDSSGQVRREEGGDEILGGANEAYRRCLGYWYPERWPAETTYVGNKKDGDRQFDVVAITPEGGRPFEIWVDAGTGLIDRMVEQAAVETRTTYLSDYRDVDGVKLPFKARGTNGEAKYDQIVTVESVELNVDLADDLFAMPGPPPADYRFAKGASSTELPFRLINNHIYLDVRLNGKGPYRLLFDSGGANVVTPTLAAELGLEPEGALQGRGVGEQSEDVGLVKVETLSVGDVTLDDQVFAVFPLEPFSDVEGVPQYGLVGYEVFKRFVVRLDYENSRITLSEPATFEYSGDGVVVPFKFNGHIPQVEGSVDGVSGKFDLDTGSRASLTLLAPFVEQHGLAPKSGAEITAVTGWGVGGPARGRVTRMESLRLGPLEVRDVVTDLSLQTKGAFTDPYVAGNVGAGVLKRFNLVFDYGAQTIVFERNANADAPDVYDRSGMWVNVKEGAFEVVDVTAGGPAEAAGLRAGDLIVAVDGRSAADVGLVPLRTRFRSEAVGTEIELRVRRDGQDRQATLKLKELI